MPRKTAPEKKKPSKQKGSSSSRETSNKRKASETNTNKETKPKKKSKFSFSTGKPTDINRNPYYYLHCKLQNKLVALGITVHLPPTLTASQVIYLTCDLVPHFLKRLKNIVELERIDKGNDWEEIKKGVKIIINNLILPPIITPDLFHIEKIIKATALLNAIKRCSLQNSTYIVEFCKDENRKYEESLKINEAIISNFKADYDKISKQIKRRRLACRTYPSRNKSSQSNCLFPPDGASSPSAGSNGASSPSAGSNGASSSSQPGPAENPSAG